MMVIKEKIRLHLILLSLLLGSVPAEAQSPLIERYHTYEEVEAQLADWDEQFSNNSNPSESYPGSGIIYHLEEIGQSMEEGLPFWAVRLSYNADIREDEPRVLFLGQCHAEEIYGVEITMELIDMFLHPDDHLSYRQNMQAILESSEIWIVPTHNPEGLTVVHGYTDGEEWLQDVTFRKNKRDTDLDGMFDFLEGVGNDSDGVDLNRNYDFNWIFGDGLWEEDNSGGTYQAHFDYYRGEAPLSELETQAIQDLALNERFLLSIAYHSSRSGNVSEQVIYPWLWAEGKMSPDGAIISTIGEAITSLLPNEAGDGYYLPVRSSSRRGNAHDWFYIGTGCFQYLIEVGSENIQPDDIDLIEETIAKHTIAAFYLMNRAIGYGQGDAGAPAYQITGLITDAETGVPISACVKISELSGPMLQPRLTDEFGRFRRILDAGTYSLKVATRGYEMYSDAVTPTSNSILTHDVALQPLPEYLLNVNATTPGSFSSLINLEITDYHGTVTNEDFSGELDLILPEGVYQLKLWADDLFPEFLEVEILSDTLLAISMDLSTELYSKSFNNLSGWQIITGDWTIENSALLSQSDLTYSQDTVSIWTELSGINSSEDYALLVELKYELEWDLDSAYLIVAGSEDSVIIWWNDQDWTHHTEIHPLGSLGELQSLEIGIIPDNSVEYRGIEIDELLIIGREDEENVNNLPHGLPDQFSLDGCFPNPFNAKTTVRFVLPQAEDVELVIYDLLGRKVKVLISNSLKNGKHEVIWDAGNLSSGVYFLRMTAGNFESVKKVILLK
jgi:hypothetical protein